MPRTIPTALLILLSMTAPLTAMSPQRANVDRSEGGGSAAPAPGPVTLSLLAIGGVGLLYAVHRRRDEPQE